MSAVTIAGMRQLEAAAISAGWTEERLLDLAGTRLGHAIGRFFPQRSMVIAYLGKGHNAGDALVAIKVLKEQFGWNIAVRCAYPMEQCAPLTQKKFHEIHGELLSHTLPERAKAEQPWVLLDGLLGTGSNGAMRAPLAALAAEMQGLRENAGARVAAVDLPSGLDADTGDASPGSVVADVTFMIGSAKRGLLLGHAANYSGALGLVPVEILQSTATGEMDLISPQTMNFGKSPRPFDFHKGMAGHVAIVAGSPTYSGAAVLAAMGALRGGAGLISLFVPASIRAEVSAKCPPEIIVRSDEELDGITADSWDSLVVGCGLGLLDGSAAESLLRWISQSKLPAVIDADALNLIAKFSKIDILTDQHIITPHPGEFKRLAPDLAEQTREAGARAFSERCRATLLLKGSRTLITRQGHALWCNSTGNPGMATGGQGDLLAGVIGARLASGCPPLEAAAFAAWICGRSAEIAMSTSGISEESLRPTDVAHHLGAAMLDWKCSRR